MLTIPERWIILALDEDTGKIKLPHSAFECGITGGMLLELAIANRIGSIEGKKVKVLDNSPVEDPLINKALGLIVKSKRPQTVLNWMVRLTMQDSRVIESLFFKQMIQKKILMKDSHKKLGFFISRRYFPVSKVMRREILKSIANLIQMKTPNDNKSLCLLGLVARNGQADKILGERLSSLLSQNSTRIIVPLEEKLLAPEFIPFLHSVLEALLWSQQSAGAY